MGYINHHAIVVTGDSYPDAEIAFRKAYEKAKELLGDLVSDVVKGKKNGYQSFFVAPDGSKEGWDLSDEHDLKRQELMNFIDSLAYEDGSNSIKYVEVSFDEYFYAEVTRKNKGRVDHTSGECVQCKEEKSLLPLEDGQGICEDCAQVMNDMAP